MTRKILRLQFEDTDPLFIINQHFSVKGKKSPQEKVRYNEPNFEMIDDNLMDISHDFLDREGRTPVFCNDNDNVHHSSHSTKCVQFLDGKKRKVRFWPNMIDITLQGTLPLSTDKPCRNCHCKYSTSPIGCPVKYFSDYNTNTLRKNQITKFIKENKIKSSDIDFFETEHLFCRVSCVKSYIKNCLSKQPYSHKYNNSIVYLTLMYKKINNIEGIPPSIPVADPIDIMEKYGGHLSVEEYQKRSGKYQSTFNCIRPLMFSCSPCIEEI
jgi:hypothetical protein